MLRRITTNGEDSDVLFMHLQSVFVVRITVGLDRVACQNAVDHHSHVLFDCILSN